MDHLALYTQKQDDDKLHWLLFLDDYYKGLEKQSYIQF